MFILYCSSPEKRDYLSKCWTEWLEIWIFTRQLHLQPEYWELPVGLKMKGKSALKKSLLSSEETAHLQQACWPRVPHAGCTLDTSGALGSVGNHLKLRSPHNLPSLKTPTASYSSLFTSELLKQIQFCLSFIQYFIVHRFIQLIFYLYPGFYPLNKDVIPRNSRMCP